jgi:alanine racemase
VSQHTDIPAETTGVLQVNLTALADNYRALAAMAATAECAGVVKADAYGTGVGPMVEALLATGCKTFFVATLDEALAVRTITCNSKIYVFNGLFPGTASQFAELDIRPVLNSFDEIGEWSGFCKNSDQKLPAAIHLDTGINRLGIPHTEITGNENLNEFELALVISHLACADEPEHPMNRRQLDAFNTVRTKLPPAPASLANSCGIMLGKEYHFDLVRPGIGLYGGAGMRNIIKLSARIAQIKDVAHGTVGYGASQSISSPARLATVTAGYADGYFRHASSCDESPGSHVIADGKKAPVIGRVSMDLLTIDISGIDNLKRGDFVELLGEEYGIDDLAKQTGTIGYEVLTSLGKRYHRIYRNL